MLLFLALLLLIDLSRRRFLSRNTSLWCAEESRRRQFASSSGDRGLRGLGDMVLDSEIDWEELVDLEADAICSMIRLAMVGRPRIENLGMGEERGTTTYYYLLL